MVDVCFCGGLDVILPFVKEYDVMITETLVRLVEVEAASREQAEEAVRKLYREGRIVLDADDYVDTDFEVKKRKEGE